MQYMIDVDSAVDTEPFLIITVKDYLWGYPSVIISLQEYNDCLNQESSRKRRDVFSDSDPFSDNSNSDPFSDDSESYPFGDSEDDDPCANKDYVKLGAQMGLFLGRNNTALDHRKINTGNTLLIITPTNKFSIIRNIIIKHGKYNRVHSQSNTESIQHI